jgi:chromosome segregation ATPase
MKPAPPETAELIHRVRQQLILAQVRIMELEDVRDELAAKLGDTEKLLTAAQTLADQKVDEAGHLAKVHTGLQAQYEHLRHMQHVTNEALNDTRQQLAGTADQAVLLTKNISQLSLEVAEANSTAAARLARLNELDAEVRAMKASRSWRWTSWLRSLERTFGGGKS